MIVFDVLCVFGMGIEHKHSGNFCSQFCLMMAQWLLMKLGFVFMTHTILWAVAF